MTIRVRCEIKTPSGSIYELGDEALSLTLRFSSREAASCEIELSMGDRYHLLYELGSEILVYADGSSRPSRKVFHGMVESQTIDPDPVKGRISIFGRDLFGIIALDRVVSETYMGMDAGDIVREIFSSYAPEVDTTNVERTGVLLDEVRLDYMTIKEALDLLSDIALFDYYSTPDLELHFFPIRSRSSGLTIGPSDLKPAPSITRSILDMKNVIYVIGGQEPILDIENPGTEGGSETLDGLYHALPFRPTRSPIKKIELYIEKLGNPEGDLSGSIVEDSSGLPTGPKVAGFSIPKGSISSPSWYPALIDEEVDVKRDYWLVLHRIGDPSNTYRFYHDGSTTKARAESPDLDTWIRHESSWNFAYRIYYGVPVVAKAEDPGSIERYGRREEVVVDRAIGSKLVAKRLALSYLEYLSGPKGGLTRLDLVDPDTVPFVGTSVRVDMPGFVNGEFVVRGVEISWRGGIESAEMALEVGP